MLQRARALQCCQHAIDHSILVYSIKPPVFTERKQLLHRSKHLLSIYENPRARWPETTLCIIRTPSVSPQVFLLFLPFLVELGRYVPTYNLVYSFQIRSLTPFPEKVPKRHERKSVQLLHPLVNWFLGMLQCVAHCELPIGE